MVNRCVLPGNSRYLSGIWPTDVFTEKVGVYLEVVCMETVHIPES